jgi:hypothetical protein
MRQDSDHYGFALFHRTRHDWKPFGPYTALVRTHLVQFCAYAPSAVIRDLFRIVCPPYRATHARPATPAETKEISGSGRPLDFVRRPCVSRLDPSWAGGYLDDADPFEAYFHRLNGHWTYAWGPPYSEKNAPSPAILLSLSSCLG